MKQTKISYWLKAITIVLGAVGIIFFGWMTKMAFSLKEQRDPVWMMVVCTWFTAVLCYLVLFEFWKVCTQIGINNSFSEENALHFHRMGICGVCAAAGFAVRLVWWIAVIRTTYAWIALLSIGEILLAFVFVVLCESLAKLIRYAYDVKHENDLTI